MFDRVSPYMSEKSNLKMPLMDNMNYIVGKDMSMGITEIVLPQVRSRMFLFRDNGITTVKAKNTITTLQYPEHLFSVGGIDKK